ncbi:MAG: type III-B CRISPR module RAMP protein Cmr1 [Methanofollis sp.]|nr:type III-B CRISPR module RAMP protein Cmr1 [Methanofollis sp.]
MKRRQLKIKKERDTIPREMPGFPSELKKPDSHPDTVTKTCTIEVITPLFGGGYEAGKVDPEMPIRASSIRGHLRFWWRATRGARYDVKELRQREGEIWGSTENPSPVIVEIKNVSPGKTYPCAYYPEGKNFPKFEDDHPPYALFPFQENKRDGIPIAECISDISFTLGISYPKQFSDDIGAALWAWVNFGGIGARTRRGCGALYCEDFSPSESENIGKWYDQCLEKYKIELSALSSPKDWPTLPETFLIKHGNGTDALQCWYGVIQVLQAFRQGKDVGRNHGDRRNRPGRSRWPEPETIREVTHKRFSKHTRISTIPDDAFPRAEFGLPIIFHFKDGADPESPELYPVVKGKEKTRMASPLILRPLQCVNGKILQMILQLNTPRVQEVVLKKAPNIPHFTKIRSPDLARYPKSPIGAAKSGGKVRSQAGSALDAFLAFAQERKNNFHEVKP